ncbi:phage tail assembly protein [Stutzerimonas kunmingensis]|uniref:phage tail assembly protein n=1 Tax=Stutzerimonas kunmingensis TaxID=1211807 RepID=UPI00241C54B2|nr:phage tail assembly protein [Stutzerimonas kunmingensis]
MSKPETLEPTEATAAVAENPNQKTVELDAPIIRGNQVIDSLTLRKPMAGELRGVSLMELSQMDVLALRTVLPRISSPTLTDVEIGRMDPADLLQCGVAVSGFLLPKAAREKAFLDA